MDYDHYTACAVGLATELVNTAPTAQDPTEGLPDPEALRALLAAHGATQLAAGPLAHTDVEAVHQVRARLRAVFEATEARERAQVVNTLLAQAGALPQLTDHDGKAWHLHYAPADVPPARRIAAEAAMGLAMVIVGDGLERLRVCALEDCAAVFVDTSRNRCRRYCDPDTCGNRAAVAAYRARQRAAQ